jgi:hypothetical protein
MENASLMYEVLTTMKSIVPLDVRSCSLVRKHLSTKLHSITSQKSVWLYKLICCVKKMHVYYEVEYYVKLLTPLLKRGL